MAAKNTCLRINEYIYAPESSSLYGAKSFLGYVDPVELSILLKVAIF